LFRLLPVIGREWLGGGQLSDLLIPRRLAISDFPPRFLMLG